MHSPDSSHKRATFSPDLVALPPSKAIACGDDAIAKTVSAACDPSYHLLSEWCRSRSGCPLDINERHCKTNSTLSMYASRPPAHMRVNRALSCMLRQPGQAGAQCTSAQEECLPLHSCIVICVTFNVHAMAAEDKQAELSCGCVAMPRKLCSVSLLQRPHALMVAPSRGWSSP